MQKIDEEDVKFKMRLNKVNDEVEEPEEPVIQAEVHELKLEKINQRVTLISILIPVLIVVVLVITYLDIKKRVVRTEDTGASEFQKLSADLESRFSSLSLRQAKLEETMAAMTEQDEKNVAAIKARLDKLQETFKEINRLTADQKELKAAKAEMVKQINTVVESSNAAATQTAAITQELKKQMDQVSQSLNSSNAQINAVEKKVSGIDQKISGIDQNKIDKSTMDLAIKFEVLKVENALKSRIDALQSKINEMQNGVSRRSSSAAPSSQTSSSKPTAPDTQAPAPDKPETVSNSKIEEQNLR